MTLIDKKKELVNLLLEKDILPTPEILDNLQSEGDVDRFVDKIFNERLTTKSKVKILFNYENIPRKRTVTDFTKLFLNRFNKISRILRTRQELQGVTSINRVLEKRNREQATFIGMISEIQKTKNNNTILTLEDDTGSIKVIFTKRSKAHELMGDVVLDEIVGIQGMFDNKVVFGSNLIIPDVPLDKEFKKSPDEVYAAVISDIHVGSDQFLEEEFKKMIKWLKGEMGDEKQKSISKKIKYLFLVGDLIDGVGIYPGQEDELTIKSLEGQYEELVRLMKGLPDRIQLIIIPGNHDAVRLAEPQPVLENDYCNVLSELPNTTILSNPAMVNIHSSDDFPGFDVLMYHGFSYDYYGNFVDSIKSTGGNISDRTIPIMQFLLQRRHLAPTQSSTQYMLDTKDNLVIEHVPDFFLSGHIHKAGVTNYRGTSIICSSCWQAKTDFQEKVGHEPEPCRVPLINLQTRAVTMMRFGG